MITGGDAEHPVELDHYQMIVGVNWGGLVGFLQFQHPLVNWSLEIVEAVDPADIDKVIGGGPGFNSPFDKSLWEPWAAIDCEDEGFGAEFITAPAHDVKQTNEFQSLAGPSATWQDASAQINHMNADADKAVGAGQWYSIKYVGPAQTIPHSAGPQGDPVPAGTTILIWYEDVIAHIAESTSNIFNHAFIINFGRVVTAKLMITDGTPFGQQITGSLNIFGDSGQFVQTPDGNIGAVDGRPPSNHFAAPSKPDSFRGELWKFNSAGFIS
jgi:hypothetical protein